MKLYIESQSHRCAIPDDKLKFLGGVYAHGELDCLAGYDMLNVDKKNSFDRRRNYYGEPAIAVLSGGKEVEALLFFWHSTEVYIEDIGWPWEKKIWKKVNKTQRGLLVAKTDEYAIEYAKKRFKERSNSL